MTDDDDSFDVSYYRREEGEREDLLRCLRHQRLAAEAERKGRERGVWAELWLDMSGGTPTIQLSVSTPDGNEEVEERVGRALASAAMDSLIAYGRKARDEAEGERDD